MNVLFCGQVPKDSNYPESTEDAVKISLEAGRLAISDGASESFDSKTWAQILVKTFVQSPEFSPDWLSGVIQEYNGQYDLSSLSWSKCASFERGSFATLLGIELFPTHASLDVLGIGDSLAVLLNGSDIIDSFPYNFSSQFKQRPELLCTNSLYNGFSGSVDFFTRHFKTWSLNQIQHPFLLCMTDALGEWALKMEQDGTPQWTTLLSMTDVAHLESIVLNERKQGRMRVDDVTLVSISFSEEIY